MNKTLKISAAIALTMSVASCGTARSVSQEHGTQQAETQPAADFTERAGNNGESVLEQLFDKRRSGFPWSSITSGRT